MINFSNLKILFENIIATGLVQDVYHSVIIREDQEGHRKPYAPIDEVYEYVGPDDTKGFHCYCRAMGPLESTNEERIGSCSTVQHRTQTLHRMVFFNIDEERFHDDLTAKLLKAFFNSGKNIRFQRAHVNIEDIITQESPTGRFFFTPSTYYIAIDFYVLLKLQSDNCIEEITCTGIKNPYCTTT